MKTVAEMQNVSKSFRQKKLFEDFSLRIDANEMLAVLGRSGSGKTTFLNILGCLTSPDSGKVVIENTEIKGPRDKNVLLLYRYVFGYVFQNFALIENESVSQNLDIALEYVNASKKEKNRMKEAAVARVGLEGKLGNSIFELSGGEQQRVALARVALKPCTIILADEPTGSLDPENAAIILDEFVRFKNEGKTIVIVTHSDEITGRCDRVVRL
ncbi:MAG: ABC transporter ATP-binding protein [Oscillospiraceae bacterium]|jgi:putative ABC transport system ATP-binding protein|nr:ABC transporter ATP-binding protein [Oscillospiraceae bacterium]